MLDYRLDDETEALRKTVREFAREVIAPQIGEFYERDEFPTADRAADGRARAVRPALPGGVRRRGRHVLRPVRRPGGAGPRRQLDGDHGRGRRLPRGDADLPVRHRGAEAGVAAPAVRRRGARRLRADRARRRLGRRRHADHRPARGRPLGHQRVEGVHHQLRHRPHPAGHGHRRHRHAAGRRQGDLGDHRAVGDAGLRRRPAVLEGRLERLGHPRAVVQRRAGARGEPGGGAGPRLRAVPLDPRRGPDRDLGAVGRAGAGLRRRVGQVRRRSARRSGSRSARTRRSSS